MELRLPFVAVVNSFRRKVCSAVHDRIKHIQTQRILSVFAFSMKMTCFIYPGGMSSVFDLSPSTTTETITIGLG